MPGASPTVTAPFLQHAQEEGASTENDGEVCGPESPTGPITSPLYRRRFVVAALYALGNALNAFLWICFAPVINVTEQRFDIDSHAANMLSLVFLFFYLPGSILNIYVTERWGLRANLILGASLNFACAWVRYAGMFIVSPHASFAVVLLGQCLGAMGQPLFTNTPTRVAATWFGEHERDAATIVVSLFNPIGNALGSLVPSLIVNGVDDLPGLMLWQAVAATVLVLLSAAFAGDAPRTPPNAAAAARTDELERQCAVLQSADGPRPHSATGTVTWVHLRAEVTMLLRNRNFCLLACSFGIGLGLFNAILTLLSQMLTPCGYDDTTAGVSGGALLGAGLVVAGGVGVALEKTRAYAPIFRGMVVLVMAAMLLMLGSLRTSSEGVIIVSFAVLGGVLIPLLPVSLETAAECSWPVSEDTGASFLMLMGNLSGIVYIFVLTALLGLAPSTDCSSVATPAAAFILANMAIAVGTALAFKKDYRRPAK